MPLIDFSMVNSKQKDVNFKLKNIQNSKRTILKFIN